MNYEKICQWISAKPVNLDRIRGSADLDIRTLESLPSVSSSAVCFFFSQAYKKDLIRSTPGILVTGKAFVEPLLKSGLPLLEKTLILEVEDPYFELARLSELFASEKSSHSHLIKSMTTSIHSSSVVHPSCHLGEGVQIGAHCVVDEGALLGNGVILYPGVYVGPRCKIGEGTVLFPRVTLYEETVIGKNTRIHAGAVIGADGFGYAPRKENGKVVGHQKIHHIGNVVIGDEVEVGANTCIDRGTMSSTQIGSKTKIDNHVQIGHNVSLGEGCIVCGNVGIAGSATLGNFVIIAGMTAINNKVTIGNNAVIGPCSAVGKDVQEGERMRGYPLHSDKDHLTLLSLQNRILENYKKEKSQTSKNKLNEKYE